MSVNITGNTIDASDCDCCTADEIETECCDDPLPARLYAEVTAPDCLTIDGEVIPIDWDGIDQYYGETTTSCTNCNRFFVRLQCSGGLWTQTSGFFKVGGGPPCLTPAGPPIFPCNTGSTTPFDCVTQLAQEIIYYASVDSVSPCCVPPGADVCFPVQVNIMP